MNHESQIRWVTELFNAESTLTLSTVNDAGLPSSTPLFYLPDEDLSLWWLSSAKSQHSLNLTRQPRVAVSIHHSVQEWEKIRGVQMRGWVEKAETPERRAPIVERYCERFHLGTFFHMAIRLSTLYAFHPEFLHAVDNSRHFGLGFDLDLKPRS
jgi:uncharacterized protein YhbP (UPF0306 family)